MKKQLLVFSLLFFVFSCKKKNDPVHGPDPVPDPPPVPGAGCSTSRSEAENIAIFPADNAWNLDISNAPIDPYSAQIIQGFAANSVKADFGSGLWENAPIGVPYVVVCANQTKVPVVFRANGYDGNYGSESDPGPYPIPLNAPIEGNGNGDSHVIAVDKENGKLYELYNASVNGDHWEASSGAVFDLRSNALRPDTWTSADAAGLPIFAGLVRYEETLKGEIDHAIRFTLPSSKVKPAYIHPARHKVNSTGGQYSLPFGARIRLKASFNISGYSARNQIILKASFNISGYSARNQIILKAMKKYGLILADIGSNLYVTGAPDERWNNDELRQLGNIKGSDFEVVKFNN